MITFVDYYCADRTIQKTEFVSRESLRFLDNYDEFQAIDGIHYMMIDREQNIWTMITGYNDKDGVYLYTYSKKRGRKRTF